MIWHKGGGSKCLALNHAASKHGWDSGAKVGYSGNRLLFHPTPSVQRWSTATSPCGKEKAAYSIEIGLHHVLPISICGNSSLLTQRNPMIKSRIYSIFQSRTQSLSYRETVI